MSPVEFESNARNKQISRSLTCTFSNEPGRSGTSKLELRMEKSCPSPILAHCEIRYENPPTVELLIALFDSPITETNENFQKSQTQK